MIPCEQDQQHHGCCQYQITALAALSVEAATSAGKNAVTSLHKMMMMMMVMMTTDSGGCYV